MKKTLITIVFAAVMAMAPGFAMASDSSLLVSSFQISGDSAYDEFVSVKNTSGIDISLDGYTLSRKSNSTNWATLFRFPAISLESDKEIVIAHSKYTGVSDYIYSTTSYLSDNYAIGLLYTGADKVVRQIDVVGYGSSTTYLGEPLPNPLPKEIYKRVSNSGNNNLDFVSSIKTAYIDPNTERLIISELFPAPDDGEEWIEIFNPTNKVVSLFGIKLCDAIGSVHCYNFEENETINPFGYKTYARSLTKITLNNTGDWVELRDKDDNLIHDSGGNYESADTGVSLSLFGSDFLWTKQATPGSQNVFVDTVEEEQVTGKNAPKSSSKKIKKTVNRKVVASDSGSGEEESTDAPDVGTVKGAVSSPVNSQEKAKLYLGYVLVGLALLLFFGYNLWENRDYAKDFYNKISRRNR